MSTTTISLARLLELNVPRAWHEVVATVLEAGHAMRLEGIAAGPAACVISEQGDLRIEGGGGDADVEGAMTALLASLLERQTAPPALQALASPGARRADGVDGLMQALAYFERPNRRSDIAALATRALAAEAQAHADAELSRLRTGPHAATASQAGSEAPVTRKSRRRPIGPATVLLLLIAVAGSAFWYLNRPTIPASEAPAATEVVPPADVAAPTDAAQTTATSLVSAATAAIASVADAGLRAIGLGPSEPAAPATSAPPPAPASAARRTTPPSTPAIDGAATAVEPAAGAPPGSAFPETVPPVVIADPDESAMPPEPQPGPFTDADTDVVPPMLVYPQLPSGAETAPPASAPHFELLVNDRGEVEQVRLRATDARLQDRMMVSAAKAWRFRPAMKDGKPVRYRVRVPIPR